ncbi:MAG: TonB-dependent siderophore receptor [Gammaproteobacteria bacterium]|nr:MAG: TonB-dependent siderophore receptor [Gammaproteobacteria bacterium]
MRIVNRFKGKSCYLFSITCITSAFCGFSLAINPSCWADDEKNQSDENRNTLSTIVVTANKIDEDILYVPQSISVFNEIDIENKGLKDAQDIYENQIPNMGQGGFYHNAISFRGLTPSIFTNNNPVVLYVDGVPQTNSHGFNTSLRNVERVEVLRGAQGTLYGKDAIGGVINIISKEPENKWTGNIGAEYGNRNYLYGYFDFDGPLKKDTLYLGLSVKGSKNDGWITNSYPGSVSDANAKEFWGVNSYLLFTPTERLRVKLNVNSFYDHSEGEDGYTVYNGPNTGIDDLSRDTSENMQFDVPGLVEVKSTSQAVNIKYDFDTFFMQSVTTHKIVKDNYRDDSDGLANPANYGAARFRNQELDNWTEELRFASQNTSGFRWVSGIFLELEKKEFTPVGVSFVFPEMGLTSMSAYSELDNTTASVFGQATLPFLNDFELTLGGRYQFIHQELDLNMYMLPAGIGHEDVMPINTLQDEMDWDTFLPKAALTYMLNDSFSFYTSIAKGYMPGGYNYFGSSPDIDRYIFDPAKTWDYEIGMKIKYRNLYLGTNIFYQDMQDVHVSKTLPGGIYLADNAKKAHSYGIEFDWKYKVTKTLSIDGSLGLIHAEYDDFIMDNTNFDGEDMLYTPAYTLNVGVNYEHPSGFFTNVDIRHEGERNLYHTINQRLDKSDGHTLVNLKLGYRFSGWEFYGFANNVTDEEYVVMYMGRMNGAWGTFNEPRLVGVGMSYYF